MDENIIFEVIGQKIIPLSINPGRIVLTSLNVYFQPFNNYEVVSYLIYYIKYVYTQYPPYCNIFYILDIKN